ncbi:MAG: glycosyltransferase family 4 protein [Actinobacteria bacterium]|nr:glycosyltransferase family 4 protein [Actinomycetota bacterium]
MHTASTVSTSLSKLTIRWVGDLYARHSLATVSRELICALAAAGDLRFALAPTDGHPYPSDTVEQLERAGFHLDSSAEAGAGVKAGYDVEVRHHWPPDFTPTYTRSPLVMIQPWEQGGIPAAWIEPIMRHVDEVWVPTNWVRECYISSGIPEYRVAVVPNGVDTSTFSAAGAQYPLLTRRTSKLLFLGGTIVRKGADILLDAYCKAFRPADDVCLVVKPFGSDAVYRGGTMDDRFHQAAADPTLPDIEILDGDMTREEVASVYRACNVLVHPYRGEGFGLPVAEAMACDLPVIVTGYGACLDFCDSSSAYMLPYSIRPISIEGMAPSSAGFWWAEPDGDALVETMREVIAFPDRATEKGKAGRARIASGFTWEMAAQAARSRLQSLVSRPVSGRSSEENAGYAERAYHVDTLKPLASSRPVGNAAPPAQSDPTTPASPLPSPPSYSPTGVSAGTLTGSSDTGENVSAGSRIASLASVASKALSALSDRISHLGDHVDHLDSRMDALSSIVGQVNDLAHAVWDQQVLLMLAEQETHEDPGAHQGMSMETDGWRAGYLDDYLDGYLQATGKPHEDSGEQKSTKQIMPVLAAGAGSNQILDHLARVGIPATNIASTESDSIAGIDLGELRQAFALLEPASWQVIAILEGIERFSVKQMSELISDCRKALVPAGILFVEAADPSHLMIPGSIPDLPISFPPPPDLPARDISAGESVLPGTVQEAGRGQPQATPNLLIPPSALKQIARQAGFASIEVAHSPDRSRYVMMARPHR